MKNVLIGLILLLWLLLGYKMCNDYNRCCTEEVVATAPSKPEAAAPPVSVPSVDCDGIICFDKDNCEGRYCDRWASYRDSLLNLIGEGQKLVITGYARQNEADYATLGQCRADAVKTAIADYISDINVETSGKVRVGTSVSGNIMCDRISFDIVGSEEQVRNSTLIYFPFNSTDKLADRSVETYLDQVAAQVKRTGQRVRLTGHTDDIGNAAANLDLGQRRANMIKNYLIGQGVTASKIIADSKGESVPVANNSSPEGRAKNRRTELQIID